ncbi:NADH:flavin oxidoreductase [Emcibacter sp.]|uniref:NADH:flavin oxidoreductase n=1 Tax=Emcibacter sp. TaxID=1979954 RepID=UPI002AA82D71|nr:NADH:flavin oxidoreductase [Emcibacter sp.]
MEIFESWTLAGKTLRNRIIKTATFEGMCPGGKITDRLIEFHRRHAEGGVAISTVAYGAVSRDARTFNDQIVLEEENFDDLSRLTAAIRNEGAIASIQLAHAGGFTQASGRSSWVSKGPSGGLNTYGMMSGYPIAVPMSHADIDRTVEDYGRAATLAKRAGFEALEIHMGHGYMISQFLSPATNKRKDDYGGSLENRLRLPLLIVKAVREAVGDDFPLLAKTNLSDGFKAGLQIDEAVEIARALEKAGLNALVMSGGFVSKTPMFLFRGESPLAEMVAAEKNPIRKWMLKIGGAQVFRPMPFEENYFRELALRVRAAVDMPLVLLGGVRTKENMKQALADGFQAVAMGRPLLHNPDLPNQISSGTFGNAHCTNCNLCVGKMDTPEGVHCVLTGEPMGLQVPPAA